MVRRIFQLTSAVAMLACGGLSLQASPTIHVKSSTTQVRKGQPFKIFLTISTPEKIDGLHVSLIPPTGFKLNPDKTVENTSVPTSLELGSSYTFVYRIDPPTAGSGPEAGGDTREQKTFAFNVEYQSGEGTSAHHMFESTELTLPFSVSPNQFIGMGLVGLIIGNLLKVFTKHKERPAAVTWQFIRTVFRNNMVTLPTGIAIGFVVLLVISRETIPTKGWYDSLAMGVAIAILSDEQLLSKVGGMKP